MREFRDGVAVITGGGSGIGRGLAHVFADEGMHVVVADIEADKAEAVAEEARAKGVRALAARVDVSSRASVEALAEQAYGEFGQVNLLCSNAGVLRGSDPVDAPEADWQWMLSVNLWGAIHCTGVFVPRMLAQGVERGERHVVYTASIAGLVARGMNVGVYSATKYAVVGFAETLADELEPEDIGVSILCPARVTTGIWLAGRNRPPEFGGVETLPADFVPPEGMDPLEVGRRVVDGVRAGRRYIITHPQTLAMVEERFRRILEDGRA